MEKYLIFLGMATVTFFTRSICFIFQPKKISEPLKKWLYLIPPAILASLIANSVAANQVQILTRIVALAIASVVAWKTKNDFLTILGGYSAFQILLFLI